MITLIKEGQQSLWSKWTARLPGIDYKVASLSKWYITAKGKILEIL